MDMTFQPADITVLRTAATLAKKAGEQAAKACEKAELTAAESEAQELAGYAAECLYRFDKMVGGVVELPSRHRQTLATGCRLFLAKLQKMVEDQVDLLVDTSETEARIGDVMRVARRVGVFAPELELGDSGVESVTVSIGAFDHGR